MNRNLVVQNISNRLQPILSRKTSIFVAIWGEPGIGKTHTAQVALREIACRSLSVSATASLETILKLLPRPQTLPAWAETQLQRIYKQETIPKKAVFESLITVITHLVPFVLHLEDLHEMTDEQQTELNQLTQALARVRGVGLLATSRTRPENFPIQLYLEPVPVEEIRELLTKELAAQIPHSASDWILQRSQGNPLFALEFLRYLTRSGSLWSDGTQWYWRAPNTDFLPLTIQALIEQRLQQINQDTALQAILMARALLPRESFANFESVWQALSEVKASDWQEKLGILQTQKLLINNDFAHPLFYEVIRQQISMPQQQKFAKRLIQMLEITQPDIAVHYLDMAQLPNHQVANLLELAVAHAARTGQRTLQAQLQTRVVKLLPIDKQVDAAIQAGEALHKVGRDATEIAQWAVSLAPDNLDAVRILVKSTHYTGQTPKGFEILGAVSAKLQATSPWKAMYFETLVAAANYQEAVNYWQANVDLHAFARVGTLERVIIAFREIGQHHEGNEILNQALHRTDLNEQERVGLLEQKANALIMQGELHQAFELLGQLVDQAKQLEMLDSLTVFLYNRANIGRVIGQFLIARDSILESLTLTHQAGHIVRGAWMQTILGMLQTDLGEYQAAESTLLEARDIHLRQNFPSAISSCAQALTRLYCVWQQPYSEFMARKYSKEAMLLERQEQTPMSLTLGLLGSAEVEVRYGQSGDALILCNQAIEIICNKSVAPLEAAAYLLRGRINKKLNASIEAKSDLLQALSMSQKTKSEIEINLIELHLADLLQDTKKFHEKLQYFQQQNLRGHIEEFLSDQTPAQKISENTMQINVLGAISLENGQQPIKIRGRKRLECLAYLLETRVVGRSEATTADLCQALYPELSDGESKAALKQLIFQIRTQMGAEIVQSTTNGYVLGAISSDIELFLQNNDSSLWRGAYLSGFGQGWFSSVQETLLYALKNTVEILAESNPQEAARLGMIWLEIEPYDLEALELTMRAYQSAGQNSSLKKLYDTSRVQLLEVGIELSHLANDFLQQRNLVISNR
jgi:DNA-binding SARP family transcriptional activator